MSITITTLARNPRRLDRCNRGMTAALQQMRRGATLHKHFARGKPVWLLSGGGEVPPDVATLVIGHPNVCDVGDSLFGSELAQTFRYVKS